MLISDKELRHYGIKGMRWGRRTRSVEKSTSSSGKRRMSNKELNARVKRLELEQRFAKLTAKPETPSKIERIIKGATTMNSFIEQGLKTYDNINKIMVIVNKTKK